MKMPETVERKFNRKFILQFIKFGLVGASNYIVWAIIYYPIVIAFENLHILANIFAYIISIFNAFFWNSKFVFKKKNEKKARSQIKVFVSYGLTLGLQTILLYIMVDLLKISDIIAPIINIAITLPINFVLNKFWAFKDKTTSDGEEKQSKRRSQE